MELLRELGQNKLPEKKFTIQTKSYAKEIVSKAGLLQSFSYTGIRVYWINRILALCYSYYLVDLLGILLDM